MRRLVHPLLTGFLLLGLVGCGGGNDGPPPIITTQILSDPSFDGDIEQTSPTTYAIVQGMSPTVQSVFAGIDPTTGTEFRAFLDFPLTGPGGVPGTASIQSAYLHIFVNSLQPATATLPIRIDLVSFQPPTLAASDFDLGYQPALASTTIVPPLNPTDVGTDVVVDVTPLMDAAQRLGLPDFQLRILEDLGVSVPARVEIDETTGANRAKYAPLLTVNYF
jgi:hypothetical protein